jgi:hypothetical protein
LSSGHRENPLSKTGTADGLSWSWHLDLDTLLAALSGPAPWRRPSPLAPHPPGPAVGRDSDLAAPNPAAHTNLPRADPLPVPDTASRSAAAGKHQSVDDDGRPSTIPADAYGQVSLALTLSQAGAEWWTNLAVDLQWRLPATGLALRDGTIDLARAKAIAEATAALDDAKARAVEDKILPRAGHQTTSQLRASLRRAVITADPEAAERRRQQAERRAKITLYPDAEGTASLSGQNLPAIRAAAAYARITALARALKAAGSEGGIDLLRSKVYLGLLLGTLPYIPPPPDAPPDPHGPPDPDRPPATHGPPDPDGPPATNGPPDPDGPPATNGPPDPDGPPATGPAGSRPAGPGEDSSPHLDDWPWINDPAAGVHKPAPERDSSDRDDSPGQDTPPSSDSPSFHDLPISEDFAEVGQSPADEDWHQGDDQSGDHRTSTTSMIRFAETHGPGRCPGRKRRPSCRLGQSH